LRVNNEKFISKENLYIDKTLWRNRQVYSFCIK